MVFISIYFNCSLRASYILNSLVPFFHGFLTIEDTFASTYWPKMFWLSICIMVWFCVEHGVEYTPI